MRETKWDRKLHDELDDICLSCSESYPPNGILFCDKCEEESK